MRGGGRTTRKPSSSAGKFRRTRRKVCMFCADKIESVDYKNPMRLRKFVSDRAKILPRRTTGNCASHQRMIMHAIKRAREIALLPFTTE